MIRTMILLLCLLSLAQAEEFTKAVFSATTEYRPQPNPYTDADFVKPPVTLEQPPALRNLLRPGDFERKSENLMEGFDPKKLLELKTPVCGVLVSEVVAGSQGEAGGVDVGSTFYELDGTAIIDFQQWVGIREQARDTQKCRFITSKGEKKELDLRPGKTGFTARSTFPAWCPDVQFAQEGPFDERWNTLVYIATKSWFHDPALCESALFQAQAAGFPTGGLADELMLQLKLSTHERDAAFAYAKQILEARKKAGKPLDLFFARTLGDLYFLRGDYEAALKLAAEFPRLFPDKWLEIVRAWKENCKMPKPDFYAVQQNWLRDDWIYRFELAETNLFPTDAWSNFSDYGKVAHYSTRSDNDQSHYVSFGPALHNFELRGILHAETNGQSNDHRFDIILRTNERKAPFLVQFAPPQTVSIQSQGYFLRLNRSIPFYTGKNSAHPFKLLCVNGWIAVYLDGLPFFEGPAGKPDERYRILLEARNVYGVLEYLRLSELIDPADKNAPYFTKPNERGVDGITRLQRAVMFEDLTAVKALLAAGADLNLPNEKQESALQTAMRLAVTSPGSKEICAFLLARPEVKEDVLTLTERGDHKKLAEWLKANPKLPAALPYTPLHLAAQKNDAAACQLLVQYGVKPNTQEGGVVAGDTPLHWVARYGNKDAAMKMLELGASIEIKNAEGMAPQYIAINLNRKEMIPLLDGTVKPPKPLPVPEDF